MSDDSSNQQHPRRTIKSFVVRAGRMGTGQIKALAELGPKFVLPYKAERIDAAATFGRSATKDVPHSFLERCGERLRAFTTSPRDQAEIDRLRHL